MTMLEFLVVSVGSFILAFLFKPAGLAGIFHDWAQEPGNCTRKVIGFLTPLVVAFVLFAFDPPTSLVMKIVQGFCGLLFGQILWYVIDHFIKLSANPKIKLDMWYHAWLSAALALLFVVGVFGGDLRAWLGKVDAVTLGAITFQTGIQNKDRDAVLRSVANTSPIDMTQGIGVIPQLKDLIKMDLILASRLNHGSAGQNDPDSGQIAAKHTAAGLMIARFLAPLASCAYSSYETGVDIENVRAEIRPVVLALRPLLVDNGSRSSGTLLKDAAAEQEAQQDSTVREWSLLRRIDASLIQLHSVADQPDCQPVLTADMLTSLGTRSQRNLLPLDIESFKNEPNLLLTAALFEAFDGNQTGARKLISITPLDNSSYNYDYWAAILLYVGGAKPSDYLGRLEHLIELTAEHITTFGLSPDLTDSGNTCAHASTTSTDNTDLCRRAYRARLFAMNLFVYYAAQAAALNDADVRAQWWSTARLYANGLRSVADADGNPFLAAFHSDAERANARSAFLDTVGYMFLVEESSQDVPDRDKVREAKGLICSAIKVSPRGGREDVAAHLQLANQMLQADDKC